MNDQASHLRELTRMQEDSFARAERTRIVAVTSGKGGVGKTNVATNLAIALAKTGSRVGVLDADFGLANIDVLLGLSPKQHLAHLLFGDATLEDILLPGPEGITIIPASSGMERMASLSDRDKDLLWVKLHPVLARLDWLIIDTAAGISNMVMDFLVKAHEILLVCSDEPTSLVDAYALVKVLEKKAPGKSVHLVANSMQSAEQAEEIHRQLNMVTQNFLRRDIDFLGYVAFDGNVMEAVRKQQAVMAWKPLSPASRSFVRLARRLQEIFEARAAGPRA